MTELSIKFIRRKNDLCTVEISGIDSEKNEAIVDIFYENQDGLLENLRKGLNGGTVDDFYFNDFVVVKVKSNYVTVGYSDDTLLGQNAYKLKLCDLIDVLEKWQAFQSAGSSNVMNSGILDIEMDLLVGMT